MSKRLRRACMASAALLLAEFFGFTAAAKPPDLPVNYYDDFAPVAVSAEQQTSSAEPVSSREPPSPSTRRRGRAQRTEGSTLAQPASTAKRAKSRAKRDTGSLNDTTTDLRHLNEARRLFQIGERCRRDGDRDMAINCYQETHLLAPMSRYGLLAIERLSEIDAQMAIDTSGVGEEQETPETVPTANPGAEQANGGGAVESGKVAAAREMFRIGERCRQNGDLDMARNCYNETRLLAPHSIYGRQAQTRLREMDAAGDSSEEQEATPENSPQTAPPSRDEGQQSRAITDDLPPLEIIQQESSSSNEPGDDISAATELVPLFVSPGARRLVIQTEDSETSGDASTPSTEEFQGWLQQTGEVLRGLSGIDIDVDVSGAGVLRFKGGIPAMGLTGTITLDEGRSYFKVQQPAVVFDRQMLFSFYVGANR